ncbi:MAG: S16 family serine protease [Candidatus Woesearchaeota archaeon]
MRGRFIILLAVFLVLLFPFAAAAEKKGSIKLLAMMEKGQEQSGTIATLDLEIKQGSGRVFLETFPLTKVSTQVSMRFAKQIACSELDIDCSNKDFFYTIDALPGIVGGPSAGAAAAVLAVAVLLDLDLKKESAITGTINAGGIIGAVGGLKGKIDAAAANGINLVIIPKGTRISKETMTELAEGAEDERVVETKLNQTNASIDLIKYGETLNITVVEAATLAEALEYMTDYKIPKIQESFVINEHYKNTMKDIAVDLCDRNEEIHKELIKKRLELGVSKLTTVEEKELNYSRRSKEAFDSGEYYSSASYCFRSNVGLKQLLYAYNNYTIEEINKSRSILNAKISDFENKLGSRNIATITDLQTIMAVKERITDAKNVLETLGDEKNITEAAMALAYAEERLYSAEAWSRLFDGEDVAFELDEEKLKESCQSKLDEAEERYNYLKSILPTMITSIREDLDDAYGQLSKKDYISCLYIAVKAKSSIDVVLGIIGVEESELDELIDLKLEIVKQVLAKAQKKGIFPIIGYSYYEYGNSLKNIDKQSVLLFSGYALEFSNLDIYFPKKEGKHIAALKELVNIELIVAFAAGLAIGLIIMWPVRAIVLKTPRKKLRKKKK